MSLNLAVTAAFIVSFVWRRNTGTDDVSVSQLVLSALSIAVLAVSGYLGGKLAFRYGVRVVDKITQAEGFLPRPST